MKKVFKLLPLVGAVSVLACIGVSAKANQPTKAADVYQKASLPTTIVLDDCSADEVRNYYSALSGKSDSERQGQNLLKSLKPILSNNQKYYDYDNGDIVWKMYEITDRDWKKSPASEMTQGTYNASTNTITDYSYGSNSNQKDNPYVKSYYMDYAQDNQVRAWGNHTQDGYGINREHLWAKSEGFDDDSSGAGARGDPMHLVAANGYANNMHNNNYFGYVDQTKTFKDSNTKYSSVGHNLLGASKTHPLDGVEVFEPQDADKGDIARAMFYMVARYNNLAGDDTTIGGANPNLSLTNDLSTWKKNGYTSTPDACGYMGVLDDLLEWNKLDPVDEYEIHRNNILFKNFTNNRNPFIDFPEWADIIWGDLKDSRAADATKDELYKGGNYTPPEPKVDDGKIFGLEKTTFFIICAAVAVVVIIIVIIIYINGSKKTKKKISKGGKKVAKELGIPVPKTTSSSSKSTVKKKSTSSSSKSTTKKSTSTKNK